MRSTTNSIGKIIASVFLIAPLFLIGCSPSTTSKGETQSSNSTTKKLSSKNLNPLDIAATTKDINLYRQIGVNYVCIARKFEVEFNKALAVAVINYGSLIEQKHGGYVKEVGDTKLTRKAIFNAAEIQLLSETIRVCPDQVPEKDKKKMDEYREKINKKNLQN